MRAEGYETGKAPEHAPPVALQPISDSAADDLAPPLEPNAVAPRDVPGAKEVGRNTLEILVFRGLSTPLALGLVVLQGRFLEPSGRGAYVVAVLGVTIFSRLLGQLGVAVTNRLGEEPAALGPLTRRAFALGVLAGAAAIPVIAFGGSRVGGIDFDVALIAALALVPNVLWQTSSGVLLGLARIRLWNYVQLGSPVLTLVGMLVLVVWLDTGVRGAVGAWALANVATAAFALAVARDIWLPPDVPPLVDRHARLLARLALAMGGVHVVNLLSYRVELFILERNEGLDAVGIYSIAMQAAEAMWLVAAAVAGAVTAPVVHEAEAAAVRLIERAAVRALLITAAVGAVLAVAAPFVIPLALGDAFDDAARPLLYLLPGVVLYAPVNVLVIYLSVRRGRPRLSLAVAATGGIVTLVLALLLIPSLGTEGAAIASSAGYAAGAALALVFFLRLSRRAATTIG